MGAKRAVSGVPWRGIRDHGYGVPSLGPHFDPQNGVCENQHQSGPSWIRIPVLLKLASNGVPI